MAWQQHTLKMRGYTDKAGYQRLDDVLDSLRWLYNCALEHRRTAWKIGRQSIYKAQQMKELPSVKKDFPEFADLALPILRAPLNRLEDSMQAFFRRLKAGQKPGFPRYKNAARYRTLEAKEFQSAWLEWVDENLARLHIKGLPGIEIWHKGRIPEPLETGLRDEEGRKLGHPNHRYQRGTWPRALRITRKGRRLFVCLVYEIDKPTLPPTADAIGIDRGVNRRIAVSDHRYAPPETPKAARRRERNKAANARRIKKHQRTLSRLRRKAVKPQAGQPPRAKWAVGKDGRARVDWGGKPSIAYRRALAVKSNIQHRQAVSDVQATHRLTTDLIRRYGVIAVENLKIPQMSKSAAGTAEEPGRNVAAKRGLNRGILAQQWGEIARQLAYKAEWAGRDFNAVDAHYTSQTCHRCGNWEKGQRHKQDFRCLNPDCGWRGNADDNAAVNILIRHVGAKAWEALQPVYPCPLGRADIVATPEPPLAGGPCHGQKSTPATGPPYQLRLAL